ncbi:MAG: hypothetical protein WKF96_07285 [Solirubrobacteraceae bacterium]
MSRCVPRLVLSLFLIGAGSAAAAVPEPRATLEDHRHNTGGQDWHIQLEVNRTGTRLASVVAYSQQCKATGFIQGQRLDSSGAFSIGGDLPEKKGTFQVDGSFTTPVNASGTWSVTTPDCQASGEFSAQDSSGHFLRGNPFEYPPDRITANAELRRMTSTFRRNAGRFTPARARALGYSFRDAPACPALVHARKRGTAFWGEVLNPLEPQSLMYWCAGDGRYQLAGAMFRAPGDSRPPTFKNLIQWHKHSTTPTANWMTHLWLTPNVRDAWATCAPWRAWEAAGMFTYEPHHWIMETKPCSDTVDFIEP